MRHLIDKGVSAAENLMKSVRDQIDAVENDRNLSPQGKEQRRLDAAREIASALRNAAEKRKSSIQSRIDGIDAASQVRVPELPESRAREIRDELRAIANIDKGKVDEQRLEQLTKWSREEGLPNDVNALEAVILEASEGGDAEVLAALASAPFTTKRRVREDVRKAAYHRLRKAKHPEQFAKIEGLREVADLDKSNTQTAEQELARIAGVNVEGIRERPEPVKS